MLTENEIARSWRSLFRDQAVSEDVFARADALLEELRPESPLRHRLETELTELRKMQTQADTPAVSTKKRPPKKQPAT